MRRAWVSVMAVALIAAVSGTANAECPVDFGDINADGSISIVDAQCVILTALWSLGGGSAAAPSCAPDPQNADLSCDDTIDVADVLLSIQKVLDTPLTIDVDADGNGCPDTCEAEPPAPSCECAADPLLGLGESEDLVGTTVAHNCARESVGVPPLKWDKDLAELAQSWANELASECSNLMHNPDLTTIGENIYATSQISTVIPAAVVGAWVNERFDYDYATNTCDPFKVCGHYTAVVWETTERVGCAFATNPDCPSFKQFWVCNYDPGGNFFMVPPYPTVEDPCVDLDNDGILQGSDFDDLDRDVGAVDCQDLDGDGFTNCAGDCNDGTSAVSPDEEEVPGDGVDNDCNPLTPDGDCTCAAVAETGLGEPAVMDGMTAAHNCVRQTVGTDPLTWDSDLSALAQGWAEQLASTCGPLSFNPSKGFVGEAVYTTSSIGIVDPASVVDQWAAQADFYDYPTNTCASGGSCGLYKQLTWSTTTHVGCGVAVNPSCPIFRQFWVCDYSPPGNFFGEWPYPNVSGACLDLDQDGFVQSDDPDDLDNTIP